MKNLVPRIQINSKDIEIVGDRESLKALGELLILKSKLGSNFSALLVDGIHKPIRLICEWDT